MDRRLVIHSFGGHEERKIDIYRETDRETKNTETGIQRDRQREIDRQR